VTWLTRNRAASNRLDQRVTPRLGLWGRPSKLIDPPRQPPRLFRT